MASIKITFLFWLEKLWGNKKLICSLGVLLLLIAAVLVYNALRPEKVYTFYEITELEPRDIVQLAIEENEEKASKERVLVDEESSVGDFLELVEELRFKLETEHDSRPAWNYRVDLYHEDQAVVSTLFAGQSVQFLHYSLENDDNYVLTSESYYRSDEDINPQLAVFFADLFLAREMAKAEEEEEEPEEEPTTVTVQEIFPAITVIFDNNPAARPSSGLQRADIVYEFLVEGGSTRYLAVFKTLQEDNFIIGPIRSLRPYFAVQSLEHGGVVAHSGYSARTREMVSGLGLTQIGDYGYFWRDSSRRAPHNLYTNINNLYQAAGDEPEVIEKELLLRAEFDNRPSYTTEERLEIIYDPSNRVHYEYDEEKDVYFRFINDSPHTDKENEEQYYADRIIVRETPHQNVPSSGGLVNIHLDGTGPGALYEGGRKYDISWDKVGAETIFLYEDGHKVEPIKGTTWIQVVRH